MRYQAARIELDRIDWAAYRTPPGAGPTVPEVFARLFDADTPDDAVGYSLEQKLEVQSMVFEVALPAVGVMLAALADRPPVWLESELLDALHCVIMGEPHHTEAALGNDSLVEQCVERARHGIWVLYGNLSRSNADWFLDILGEADPDAARVEAFRRRHGL